ncbi:metallophosphoesterase [Rhizobium sp. KVB221]|uniref:Metallophosphoesterase n=1 Tax=Rhizobium setariae TaxID=2801340 RepID=A0A937CP55_9HYPH|nr:metallophosphoesterase [Rhizobium setariae]MBL0372023.1 metallophosphoesterase [Rhizobium setariae]
MFTLAHISDVHLGPLPDISFGELLSKRITGYVNWQRNRRKHLFGNTLELLVEDLYARVPDHLAITGDLVNLAASIEIDAAAAWLRSLGKPHDISVVPGNHDAYVPNAIDEAVFKWNSWMSGDEMGEGDRRFPFLRIRGKIALIGLSTATATPPFMASGYFGSNQARRFANILKQTGDAGLFRVVMIHHPPIRGATANYKRMMGIRRFGAAVHIGGAELVLHGHTHLNTVNWLRGPTDAPIPVVGIASASQGQGGRKPPAAYNLFHIDGEKGSWSIKRERYQLTGDGSAFLLDETSALINPAFA